MDPSLEPSALTLHIEVVSQEHWTLLPVTPRNQLSHLEGERMPPSQTALAAMFLEIILLVARSRQNYLGIRDFSGKVMSALYVIAETGRSLPH